MPNLAIIIQQNIPQLQAFSNENDIEMMMTNNEQSF